MTIRNTTLDENYRIKVEHFDTYFLRDSFFPGPAPNDIHWNAIRVIERPPYLNRVEINEKGMMSSLRAI
jgi:hypothetical protein